MHSESSEEQSRRENREGSNNAGRLRRMKTARKRREIGETKSLSFHYIEKGKMS